MDFESLKEQLIERFQSYRNQIQDSELYIKLKERYDGLTPNIQAVIKFGSLFFVIYFFYSIPASYTTSADEKMTYFEENRQLTRDLIRAGRLAKTVSLPPPAPASEQLKQQIENKMQFERVLPEQKGNIGPAINVASKSLVPKQIKQSGVKASIKKLNLKQTIKLGESFNSINSSKLMNLAIQADTEDPHYFNVDYEVAAFDVPRDAIEEAITEGDDKKSKSKKSRSRFKSKKKKDKKSKKK